MELVQGISPFDYDRQPKESISCNLCGTDRFFILSRRSKNHLPVQACLCKTCGLIYINPRMTKEGYDLYYKYFYRSDRSRIKDQPEPDEGMNFEDARKFGSALGRRIRSFIAPGMTIDVGSSTGGLLCGLKDVVPDLELLGIEPSVAESNFANAKGIKTITALFENMVDTPLPRAANIFCVQTFNHLLDPRHFLAWSHARLIAGGHLVLAVKNFRHQARRAGSIEAGVQIDHPYMFIPETLKLFVESAGFRVVYLDVDEGKSSASLIKERQEGLSVHHIRLVGEKPKERALRSSTSISARRLYQRVRFQLFRPVLFLYYLLHYSQRLSFLRPPTRKPRVKARGGTV